MNPPNSRFTWKPLTPDTWSDFETLFGPKGACGGCWCMTWRLPRKEYTQQKGEGNRQAMQGLVAGGSPVGVLAYDESGRAAGWCAVAPRSDIYYLQTTRTLKTVDDQPVWSITCFFVAKDQRGLGLSKFLIGAAEEYVRSQGGTIMEAYPLVPQKTSIPDAFAWTGLPSPFEKAGYEAVPTKSESRLVMRKRVGG